MFDRVFDETWGTRHIYEETCLPVVQGVVEGFNGTIFAYGQTSSGKTYTMRGSKTWDKQTPKHAHGKNNDKKKKEEKEEKEEKEDEEEFGILPLAVKGIFKRISETPGREFLLRIAFMEIYNEDIIDLLAQASEDGKQGKRKLLVKERPGGGGPYVCGLREEIVTNEEQVAHFLKLGDIHRHVGETKMNRNSSRSHTLFQMVIESRVGASGGAGGGGGGKQQEGAKESSGGDDGAIRVSKLTLVDLAGSERLSKTCAEGTRAKEGAYINKSLLTLGTVINKLSDESTKTHKHIPYRDSKLTRILQTALGGNSKTAMISNITPSVLHMDETHSTLRFATRTKSVQNNAVVNEVLNDDALLKRQQKEIERLRDRLKEKNNGVDIEATEAAIADMKDHLIQVKEQNKSIEEMLLQERNEKQVMKTDLQHKSRKLENLTSFILKPSNANAKEGKSLKSGTTRRSKKDRMSWCPSSMPHPSILLEHEKKGIMQKKARDDLQMSEMQAGLAEGEGSAASEVKLLQQALLKLRKQLNASKAETQSNNEKWVGMSEKANALQNALDKSEGEKKKLEVELDSALSVHRSYQEETQDIFRAAKEAQERNARELQSYIETTTESFDELNVEVLRMGKSLEEKQQALLEEKRASQAMAKMFQDTRESLDEKFGVIGDLQNQAVEARAKLHSKDEKITALEGVNADTLRKLEEAMTSKEELRVKIDDLEEQIRAGKEAELELSTKLTTALDDISSLTLDRDSKEVLIQTMESELRSLREDLEGKDSALKLLEDEKQQSLQLLKQVEVLKEDLGKCAAEQNDALACICELESETKRSHTEIDTLNALVQDTGRKLAQAEKDVSAGKELQKGYEAQVSNLESSLKESQKKSASYQDQNRKMEIRIHNLTERLSSAVGSQSKLSEDLRISREYKITASRREREMDERMEAVEEKLQQKDQLVCEYEVKVANLEAELATSKQKNSEVKAKSSQLKAELIAETSSLKDKNEALERKVQRLEVMKSALEENKEQKKLLASLQNELKASSSECRYWKQQTKELAESKRKQGGSTDRLLKLEKEKKLLSSSLESAEERAEQLALQVAELNAQISSTNSKLEEYKNLNQKSLGQLGDELSGLEAKQLVVIESQGGIVRMIDSFLKNRRRMAKLQAVYNDMKAKVGKVDNGEDVFEKLRSVSELEYDLHYMSNKKKSFESKYLELKKQLQAPKGQQAPSLGKENVNMPVALQEIQ